MALEIQKLTCIYNRNRKTKEVALTELSLQIKQGEFVGILGRSGAGKSTLIRSINQLVRPTSGDIVWNGKVISQLKGKELRGVRSEMGMIFQQFNLIPRLTVEQNALLGSFSRRTPWKNYIGWFSVDEMKQVHKALHRVGIDHLAKKRVDQLSGGQQQRVAIARVIMQRPKLLLGDEPVASLDPVTSKQVMELIKEVHVTEGMTTLINLHDVGIALEHCDRIIGLTQLDIADVIAR